ncbi:MAG: hypothetical protein K0Q90_474 [Paenibacillaceae bacterium]|nr:hypothetical protein [Paenibacillaceae bacterium]
MSGLQKLGCLLVILAVLGGCTEGDSSSGRESASAVPSPSASTEDYALTQAFLDMVGNLYRSYGKPDYDEKVGRIQSAISDKRVNLNAKKFGTGETALTLAWNGRRSWFPCCFKAAAM